MERPQVRPRTEGWEQRTDDEGRPKLEFKQPRVTQPAQHLADMDMSEREEKVKELGLPAFRARQLSTHYFSHYTTDPAEMTDLPADKRDELAETFFPHLLTEVRRIETEDRQTIKFLW
ncbi:MAG: 23S rRNA (adenine(2503)-C(2))-methyltransferase RlmN, partial [Yaniella sp.]|nr:23S rRNA (adenine(2503)-C(2))-methyltransferase RlmN [Yaniella sp.]